MFNELTTEDIITIDKVISKRNKDLYDKGVFLSWTFPKNHRHETQSLSSNYFCVWGGLIDDVSMKLVCFSGVWLIPDILDKTTDEEIILLITR